MPAIGKQPNDKPKAMGALAVGGMSDQHYDWLNPLNKTILISTFRHKIEHVKLDHREYVIDYDRRPGYAWVRPKQKYLFVPCGWFKLDRMNAEWLMKG